MKDLRARCDWDRVQTHQSLRPYLIEEAHEVDDAIAGGDDATLRLESKITPNAFGGAGVAWHVTTPRGNINVYSRFAISYPDAR